MCGPGGEVPAVFVTAGDPTPRVLCAQGVAPRRATTALLRDELGLAAIPGTGLLPATVPGAWDGWLTLLRDHGTFPLADVLGPALGYARARLPAGAAGADDDRRRRAALPRALAQLGGHVAARRPGAHHDAPAARPRRDLAQAARGGRRPHPRGADRRGPRRLVPRVRRRGDRGVHGHAGARRHRARPRGPAHRRRPRGLVVLATRTRWSSRRAGAGRWPSPGRGRRVRCSRRPCSSCGTPTSSTSTACRPRPPCTASPRPRSSRSPTGRPGTATARPSRSRRWSRARTPTSGGPSSRTRRRWSCGPAPPAGPPRGWPPPPPPAAPAATASRPPGSGSRRPRRPRASGSRPPPTEPARARHPPPVHAAADRQAARSRAAATHPRPGRARPQAAASRRAGYGRGPWRRRRRPAGYGRRRTGWSLGADGRVGCGRCRRAGWSLGADG